MDSSPTGVRMRLCLISLIALSIACIEAPPLDDSPLITFAAPSDATLSGDFGPSLDWEGDPTQITSDVYVDLDQEMVRVRSARESGYALMILYFNGATLDSIPVGSYVNGYVSARNCSGPPTGEMTYDRTTSNVELDVSEDAYGRHFVVRTAIERAVNDVERAEASFSLMRE